MNIELARYNMIEQQIRPWDVLDDAVLDLLFEVRREDFVPAAYRKLAFVDMEIPLGHGEVMLEPKLEARILQSLDPKPIDRVLEIGTGSGYLTALLAKRAQYVYSVEIVPELKEQAECKLREQGVANVTVELGDGAQAWDSHGPYDVVVLTGSVEAFPEAFLPSLNPGGRLFAVVGDDGAMSACLATCVEKGVYRRETLFETVIPPLRNAKAMPRFKF